MKITQDIVSKTSHLLDDYTKILDNNPEVSGELRVKLAIAELILYKIAKLMNKELGYIKNE
jgi:hypothetical protein